MGEVYESRIYPDVPRDCYFFYRKNGDCIEKITVTRNVWNGLDVAIQPVGAQYLHDIKWEKR